MEDRIKLRDKKKIVIKIGTSSLTHSNGRINFERIEKLTMVLSDLRKSGRNVMLVTSGAIAVGASKIGLTERPSKLAEKQALAAIGQAELIKIYDEAFSKYSQISAQVLLTKDGVMNPIRRYNAKNTLNTLMNMQIIPIINENDTVSTDEIEFGDNDTLSAHVASLTDADLLIILSDIDGLYSGDPRKDANATIISKVNEITNDIEEIAGSTNSAFAKGGMATKISAAKICNKAGIDMIIAKGEDPAILFDVLDGKEIGTLFVARNEYDIHPTPNNIPSYLFREKRG
jgi:glutamate 5-kinase